MKPSYELFDHTADMGIRIHAGTRAELLKPAAQGLYAAIGEFVPQGRPTSQRIDLGGTDAAYLLRDFLAELLMHFERDLLMITDIDDPQLDDNNLRATLRLAPVDPDGSVFFREVKAITYHELEIRSIPDGYEATLIIDI